MPKTRICRLPKVVKMTGLSRSAIYALIAEGRFPSQINLGPRTVGWAEREIHEWIEMRIADSRRADAREVPDSRNANW
jgi:prophage regulatory protein